MKFPELVQCSGLNRRMSDHTTDACRSPWVTDGGCIQWANGSSETLVQCSGLNRRMSDHTTDACRSPSKWLMVAVYSELTEAVKHCCIPPWRATGKLYTYVDTTLVDVWRSDTGHWSSIVLSSILTITTLHGCHKNQHYMPASCRQICLTSQWQHV